MMTQFYRPPAFQSASTKSADTARTSLSRRRNDVAPDLSEGIDPGERKSGANHMIGRI